jgi:hypothetical protein
MDKLICMSCGREPYQPPPGIMYIEYFFRNECSCGTENPICPQCLSSNSHRNEHCKSCKRDIKINEVLDATNN